MVKKCKVGLICCYQDPAHSSSSMFLGMSVKDCDTDSLECKQGMGEERNVLSVSFRADYASQEQVEEIRDLLEKAVMKICRDKDLIGENSIPSLRGA